MTYKEGEKLRASYYTEAQISSTNFVVLSFLRHITDNNRVHKLCSRYFNRRNVYFIEHLITLCHLDYFLSLILYSLQFHFILFFP